MENVLKTWFKPLEPILKTTYFNNLIKYLNIQYDLSRFSFNKIKIYPEKNKVFNCFNCDFNKLKLVIIGSEPFEEYSEGLAFDSTDSKIRLHPIAELLRYNIEHTFYEGFNLKHDHSLNYLVEQGVLLLNESLTIQNNKTNIDDWEEFITFVINKIQERHTGIIFYINENSKLKNIINKNTQYLLTYKNPLEFVNKPNKWDFDLQKVNDIIEKNNGKECIIKF